MAERVPVPTLDEAETHISSLTVRVDELERLARDHAQRLDTLQTPVWRRIVFRLDGWPGQRDLNADRPSWRPWRRWWTS
jgi:hypothetical protein